MKVLVAAINLDGTEKEIAARIAELTQDAIHMSKEGSYDNVLVPDMYDLEVHIHEEMGGPYLADVANTYVVRHLAEK